ncbi:MAG TPA: ABC transporter permease [Bacteroidales bacterium]|nr:ABC transporter permease [Bacteroidales bacterium]
MNKTSLIIQREYTTRVRKKSFIIMTLLTPFLIALVFVIPALLMSNQDKDFKKIAVVGDSDLYRDVIPDTKEADFEFLPNTSINDIKNNFSEKGYYGVLYISDLLVQVPTAVQLISKQQPPIGLTDHINNSLRKELEKKKLQSYNIENLDEILKSISASVDLQTIKIDETGEAKTTSTGFAMALAYISGLLMYMLVFMFGSQVMRGVIEEKTSRIVEVIISSVKPIQLMLGKIIGIALVGLTQFAVWILLTVAIVAVAQSKLLPEGTMEQMQQLPQSFAQAEPAAGSADAAAAAETQMTEFQSVFASALNQPWGLIIFAFAFYFITGYLLYASLFAAIGSAVDNETETQQFMLPVTIPILLGLFVAMATMQNPESSVSFWFSLIPLTSPIVMVARIPFDVPAWEIALSMALMLVTIFGCIWMAARIYRTGILMYGKKTSYREIWKWLTYKG